MKFKKPTLKTSRRMKKVKSRGTKPEKIFASLLRENGIKYQGQPKLFGKPDFRVKDTKVLIFCDSSFWHGRNENDLNGKSFRTNRNFWVKKLKYNKALDERTNHVLRKRGWVVLRFWDDVIYKQPSFVVSKLNRYIAKRTKKTKRILKT